ncbi:MAG TPA: carboxypeptidase-like regulatory domain-containing protein, partial [Thermodesulfobacteriota bacterium]|nr:carboxypeptidase-like regulatory domain-containing protein [Thermodesulfobacteriota bacterium]
NQKKMQDELSRVSAANEEKRKLLGELAAVGSTYIATRTLLTETQATISDITKNLDASRTQALSKIKAYYGQKRAEVNTLSPYPWEKKSDFNKRKEDLGQTYRKNEYDETTRTSTNYDQELARQTGDLKERLAAYRSSVFVLTGGDVALELGKFDPETEQFQCSVRSLSKELPFSKPFSLSIKSSSVEERKGKYQKVTSTYGANGYTAKVVFGFTQESISPLVFGFSINDLTDGNREIYSWVNPAANASLCTIDVGGSPSGAEFFVDGVSHGKQSDERGAFHIEGILPGDHRIEVALAGYETAKVEVKLGRGGGSSIEAALVPVPGTKLIQDAGFTFSPGIAFLRMKLDAPSSAEPAFFYLDKEEFRLSVEGGSQDEWQRSVVPSGAHSLSYEGSSFEHLFEQSRAFSLDAKEGHLYDISIRPRLSLPTDASKLPPGFKAYPPEPELLPEFTDVQRQELHPNTDKAVGGEPVFSVLFGLIGGLFATLERPGVLIGDIIGSTAGFLGINDSNPASTMLWSMGGTLLGSLVGLTLDLNL